MFGASNRQHAKAAIQRRRVAQRKSKPRRGQNRPPTDRHGINWNTVVQRELQDNPTVRRSHFDALLAQNFATEAKQQHGGMPEQSRGKRGRSHGGVLSETEHGNSFFSSGELETVLGSAKK
jgi:hypothetical protein